MSTLRKIILAVVFNFSLLTGASATEVEATGYGSNFDQQLKNAKLDALQKVVGTFIVGDQQYSSEDKKVFEKIYEYHGGYIKDFDIIDVQSDKVIIKADVEVVKDNRIIINEGSAVDSISLNQMLNIHNRKSEILKTLDDPKKAFAISSSDSKVTAKNHLVNFSTNNVITWQPKWISDLKTFVTHSEVEGSSHTNVREKVAGSVLNQLMSISPFAAVAGVIAEEKTRPTYDKRNNPMVCFAKNQKSKIDDCYNLSYEFNNIKRYSDIKMNLTAYSSNGDKVYSHDFTIPSDQLYSWAVAGDHKDGWFGTKITFDQPALIVYTDVKFSFTTNFNIDSGKALNISRININPI